MGILFGVWVEPVEQAEVIPISSKFAFVSDEIALPVTAGTCGMNVLLPLDQNMQTTNFIASLTS